MPRHLLARAVAAVSICLLSQPAAATATSCTLHKILGVPVRTDRSLGLVLNATIDQWPVRLVVDTAKGYSALSLPFAERAGVTLATADVKLNRRPGGWIMSHAASDLGRQALGASDTDNLLDESANIGDLAFGGAHSGAARMAVLAAGSDGSDQRPAGFVGADYLLMHDVEYDAADGMLNLFDPLTCAEPPVYWSASYGSVPFTLERDRQITIKAKLDGQPVRAVIDTGSGVTTMPLAVAEARFLASNTALEALPTREALDGTIIRSYRGSFHRLEIGELSVHNPQIALDPARHGAPVPTGSHLDASQPAELLIGADILNKLRTIIAYGDRRIYYTVAEPTLL